MLIVAEVNSGDDSREQNVSCINVDIGTRQTISFELAGPGMFTPNVSYKGVGKGGYPPQAICFPGEKHSKS